MRYFVISHFVGSKNRIEDEIKQKLGSTHTVQRSPITRILLFHSVRYRARVFFFVFGFGNLGWWRKPNARMVSQTTADTCLSSSNEITHTSHTLNNTKNENRKFWWMFDTQCVRNVLPWIHIDFASTKRFAFVFGSNDDGDDDLKLSNNFFAFSSSYIRIRLMRTCTCWLCRARNKNWFAIEVCSLTLFLPVLFTAYSGVRGDNWMICAYISYAYGEPKYRLANAIGFFLGWVWCNCKFHSIIAQANVLISIHWMTIEQVNSDNVKLAEFHGKYLLFTCANDDVDVDTHLNEHNRVDAVCRSRPCLAQPKTISIQRMFCHLFAVQCHNRCRHKQCQGDSTECSVSIL